MRRGVRVPAHNRHSGLRRPLLRAYDMNDALPGIGHGKLRDAEFLTVPVQGLDLKPGDGISDPGTAVGRRHIVVRDRKVCRLATGQTCRIPKTRERLRGGHFMQELQINVDQRGAVIGFAHQVLFPKLVVKGFSGHLCLLEGGRF